MKKEDDDGQENGWRDLIAQFSYKYLFVVFLFLFFIFLYWLIWEFFVVGCLCLKIKQLNF